MAASFSKKKEEVEVCLAEQRGVMQLDHLATYMCLTRPDPSPVADRELLCLYCIEDYKTQKIILPVTYSLPTFRKVSERRLCRSEHFNVMVSILLAFGRAI